MKYVKLEDICEIIMGQSPDSKSYRKEHIGLPFYQGNADFGLLNPTPTTWCNEPKKIAENGDILISVRAPIGALNIATEKCCIGRGLAALRNKGEVDTKYIYRFLFSKKNYLNGLGTGTTFKAIGKSILHDLQIPLPPKDQQQKIATHLDKITEAINNKKKQLALFDELVKSKFVEMFGDPVTNEMGWENKYLTDFATTRLGKMLDKKKQTGKSSFPYLANFNVQWFRFDFSELHQMDFFEEDQKEFELLDGDLLVCEGGEIGRCAVWHNEIQPCYFQKALHRVRCDKTIADSTYLAYWFKFNCEKNAFDGLVGASATIPHLTGEKLKSLQIPLPPLPLQNQFTEFVQKCDRAKSTVKQEITCLQELLDSKMQEYFG